MSIQRKKGASATILAKAQRYYDPATFDQHKMLNFIECDADYVIEHLNPIEFDFLPGRKFIAFDTETFYTGIPANRMPYDVCRRYIQRGSKNIPQDFPFCFSICDGTTSFVVYDSLQNGFKEFHKCVQFLADSSIEKIAHNFDYDLHMAANTKTNIKGRLHDTLYLSKLTRADAFTHALLAIAEEIQSDEYPTVTVFEHMLDAYKSANKVTDYSKIPRDLMTQYTGGDTWNAIQVFKCLYPRMMHNNQQQVYDLECEVLLVAFHMERAGILMDPDYLHDDLIPALTKEMEEAEREIYETAGTRFNINSSAQLYSVLEKLGYGSRVKFKKPTDAMLAKGQMRGNPSFDKIEMERLSDEGVPLIQQIQKYRAAEKLLNTFAIKLYEMRDFSDTVHCSVNTIEAKTGRFSISNPSMQNMPRRKDSRVRGAFIPPKNYTLYDFDFKAQESFILCHYAQPATILQYLKEGKEIHKAFASMIYGIPYDEVSKDLRNVSKSVEFAIVYGAGGSKVASMTGLSLEDANKAMADIKRNIPEIDIFIRTANQVGKERRMVRTRLNRWVYLEKGREYACVNYVIQGSAADSTKGRMVDIYKFLRANNYKTHMILQVHDSLLQCVHKDEEDFILGYLRYLQTERELFRVDVNVDVAKCSPTWRDKEDIDVPCVEPPANQLEKMRNYNIFEEGIIGWQYRV